MKYIIIINNVFVTFGYSFNLDYFSRSSFLGSYVRLAETVPVSDTSIIYYIFLERRDQQNRSETLLM